MNKSTMKRLSLLPAVLLCMIRCSLEPMQLTGGSSDTEVSVNAVAGNVVDQGGRPVANAIVRVRPFLLDDSGQRTQRPGMPITNRDAYTDLNGQFKIDSIDSGTFCLEVNSGDSIAVLRIFTMNRGDSCIHFQVDTMKPTITITGVIVPGGPGDVEIQINGLDRRVTIDSSGRFTVRIPAGAGQIRANVRGRPGNRPIDLPKLQPGAIQDIGAIDASDAPPPFQACNDSMCDVSALRLFLNDCGLNTVPVDSVATFRNGRIVGLILSHRGLRTLPPEIARLSMLETLDLHGNMLTEPMRAIELLSALKTLRLDSNGMQYLTDRIGSLRHLVELDISNNELSSLPISITALTPAVLNLADNRLLNMTGTVAQWAAIHDPDWLATQRAADGNFPYGSDKKNGGP